MTANAARDYARRVSALADEPALNGAEPPEALPGPVRLADVVAEARSFLADGLFVLGEPNAVAGDGDSGKSGLLAATVAPIAAHGLVFGELATVPGTVLIASGEDPASEWRMKIEAICRGQDLDLDLALQQTFIYDEGVDLDDPRWQRRMIEAANDVRAVVAVFDPLADLVGSQLDENSNSDARRITRYLRRFASETSATPLLALHVSKPAEGKTDRRQRIRGASAWRNALRMVWWVEPCDGGLELDPIKANRLAKPAVIRLRRTIASHADNQLAWKTAHYAIDRDGEVVGVNVLKVLRYVAECASPPGVRDVQAGDHGVSRDAAREALAVARHRGWIEATEGPRRALLHAITDTGRARLMLDE